MIIATYRRAAELERSLVSLAQQTYRNLEVILVDDNANQEWNQKVSDIVERLCSDYSGMDITVIVNKENLGSAKARNVGISCAQGEYISFLDDDDIYLPEKINRQVIYMEKNNLDYSITDLYIYGKNNRLIEQRIRRYIKETTPNALKEYHLMYHMTGTDTLMFKASYLNTLGGFGPDNVGDEYYLVQRAIDAKGKFGYLPGCDVKAYIHTTEGGVSSGDGKIQGENKLYAYKKSYFKDLDAKTKRYIRMRHYAVIAFAEVRRGNIISFLKNVTISIMTSPKQCLKLFYCNFIRK